MQTEYGSRQSSGFNWIGLNSINLANLVRKSLVQLRCWHQRSRSRAQLAQLEPWLLEDLGLTSAQVKEEAAKRFWQD